MAASTCRLYKQCVGIAMRYYTCETSYLVRLHYLKLQSKNVLNQYSRRFCSASLESGNERPTQTAKKKDSVNISNHATTGQFDQMVEERRCQAKASVIIQVGNPSKSAAVVNQICSAYGTVKQIHQYSQKSKELLLFELDSEEAALNLLHSCSHNDSVKSIPTMSPFLWLRGMPGPSQSSSEKPIIITEKHSTIEQLQKQMSQASSISEQIDMLNDHYSLSEMGKRLRWVTCIQVERMLSSLFHKLRVWPFGSSVNGCGRKGSDLDMVISLDGHCSGETEKTPLVFQAKAALSDARFQNRKHLELFGDILQQFATGCTQIQRILQARVPIVKFHHEFTGIDCDLSIGTLSGVYMSELLYLFGEIDPRFRPLVTAVRHWGSTTKLTNPIPGATITNFTLTLLVVFYLQRCTPAILPSFNEMITRARPRVDTRRTNDIDCTFLRDPSVFQKRSQKNEQSLEELFVGFLQFIEAFNFEDLGLSIIWGDVMKKSERCPLYVQNPLERELNVSKNVSIKEVVHLGMEARNTLFQMESSSSEHWGLLAIPRAGIATSTAVSKTSYREQKSMLTSLSIKNLFLPEGEDEKEQDEAGKVPVKSDANPIKGPINGFVSQIRHTASQSLSKNSANLDTVKQETRTVRRPTKEKSK